MTEFFAWLYELINYQEEFNSLLYGDESNPMLYIPIGTVLLLTSLILPLIFYYVINHPRFNKIYHWGIVLLGSLIINFLYSFFTLNTEFDLQGFGSEFSTEVLIFSLINSLWAFVSFSLFSNTMRWFSRNSSKTPFPL